MATKQDSGSDFMSLAMMIVVMIMMAGFSGC